MEHLGCQLVAAVKTLAAASLKTPSQLPDQCSQMSQDGLRKGTNYSEPLQAYGLCSWRARRGLVASAEVSGLHLANVGKVGGVRHLNFRGFAFHPGFGGLPTLYSASLSDCNRTLSLKLKSSDKLRRALKPDNQPKAQP